MLGLDAAGAAGFDFSVQSNEQVDSQRRPYIWLTGWALLVLDRLALLSI